MMDAVIAESDTDAVAKRKPGRPEENGVDAQLVDQLVEQARTAGLQLTGEGGLLQQLTKRVLESDGRRVRRGAEPCRLCRGPR